MFVCSQVVDNVCVSWVEFSILPPITITEALQLGSLFVGVSAVAYCGKVLAKHINPWS